MKAIVYRSHGAASEVLKLEELAMPEPQPGEVLVRVRISGVNPTDWKARSGKAGAAIDRPFQVPNQDGAGEITSVGAGVDKTRIGQRVWIYNAAWRRSFGTGAQYCCVPSEQAVPLPDGVSFEVGASLGIPAMTAHRALFADGPLLGRTVLVTGGAGAVSHYAIALARWAGARVLSTASSPEKMALARRAGAHHVFNYRTASVVDEIRAVAPTGVERIVELAPAANAKLNRAILAENGTLAIYASDAPEWSAPIRELMFANTTLRFILVYLMPDEAKRAAVADINAALSLGALPSLDFHRFRLEEMAKAHDAVERGAVGKVLVTVD
jgi:NADPH2:quinone reductase